MSAPTTKLIKFDWIPGAVVDAIERLIESDTDKPFKPDVTIELDLNTRKGNVYIKYVTEKDRKV